MKIKEKSSYGVHKPVIPSSEVELHSHSFKTLEKMRAEWQLQDHYENSGPVQFAGLLEHLKTKKLTLEHLSYQDQLREVNSLTKEIEQSARFGVHEEVLSLVIN